MSTTRVKIAAVTAAPLDEGAHSDAVTQDSAGAVVTFTGVIRERDHGRAVTLLDFEFHPHAPEILRDILVETAHSYPGAIVAASHRVGPLPVGETALVAAVSAPHRAEAFDACAHIVDTIKERLPIWKKQVFTNGTEEWVGSL